MNFEETPWTHLDEAGTGLSVDHFITTQMSRVGNALRRVVTLPYADDAGVTVSEWRMLSVMAHAGSLSFSELVVQSTADKALVSRTLRLLEGRGLVRIHAEGSTPRKKLTCSLTPEGQALHDRVIPVARARQAAMIRVLTPEERTVMFRALQKLHRQCIESGDRGLED